MCAIQFTNDDYAYIHVHEGAEISDYHTPAIDVHMCCEKGRA